MSTEDHALPILPGATLGILGGGQLGRMFTVAAQTMGYRVVVLDPDSLSPAGRVADVHLAAGYDDAAALAALAAQCQAVTTEFENVPAASLIELQRHCRVTPSANAVAIAQDRSREKTWLATQGFATAPFAVVRTVGALDAALSATGVPAVLKLARFGYDGKGQARVDSLESARAAFVAFGEQTCVLERIVALDAEVSVVLARTGAGETAVFPVAENRHAAGILDISVVPAGVDAALAAEAQRQASAIADALDYVGILAVEFFIAGGQVLVNEVAPRPHNSGHYTLDACVTDQFEQQVRVLCGLPLGDTRLLSAAAMLNILGDRWRGGEPAWNAVFTQPAAKLHLYGKDSARPGRKMGHCTVLADDAPTALRLAEGIRDAL